MQHAVNSSPVGYAFRVPVAAVTLISPPMTAKAEVKVRRPKRSVISAGTALLQTLAAFVSLVGFAMQMD